MTDREFWKKLDEISRQEMSAMRELSFQSLLKQGYEENRGILIAWQSKPTLSWMADDI